jgi:hypothetical protein
MLQRHCLPADDSMDPLVFLSENLSVSLSVCLSLSRERVRARTHTHKYTHPHPHILRSNKQVVILLHAHMRLACTSIDLFFLLPYSLFIFIFDNPVAPHTHTQFFSFLFSLPWAALPWEDGLAECAPSARVFALLLFDPVCVGVCVCVCVCVYVRVCMCVYVSVYEIALRITCTGSCEPTKKKSLPTCTEFRTAELYVKDKNKAS